MTKLAATDQPGTPGDYAKSPRQLRAFGTLTMVGGAALTVGATLVDLGVFADLSVGDGLLEGHRVADGPCGCECVFPERRAGSVRGVVVIRPGGRREGSAHLVAQRGGSSQEPRRPLRPALHSCYPG
jgi:hypothetical protein